jgi:hypothetical protein
MALPVMGFDKCSNAGYINQRGFESCYLLAFAQPEKKMCPCVVPNKTKMAQFGVVFADFGSRSHVFTLNPLRTCV